MIRLAFSLCLSVAAAAPAFAADVAQDVAGPFRKFLGEGAPECVPIKDIRDMAKVIELTPEQFQFVRALYVSLPPLSRELPAGDHAIIAKAGDAAMLALTRGGAEACARFMAPDFIQKMLDDVATGPGIPA